MVAQQSPHPTVVLARSVDGKSADFRRSPARFGSSADKFHLEKQIAAADAVLLGAGTLRAYGTTLTVSHPQMLQHWEQMGKLPQPIQILVTNSALLNREISFFKQPQARVAHHNSRSSRVARALNSNFCK